MNKKSKPKNNGKKYYFVTGKKIFTCEIPVTEYIEITKEEWADSPLELKEIIFEKAFDESNEPTPQELYNAIITTSDKIDVQLEITKDQYEKSKKDDVFSLEG